MVKKSDIVVLDGLVKPAAIKKIQVHLMKSPWTYSEVATNLIQDPPRHWATELDAENPHVQIVHEAFRKHLLRQGRFHLKRVYCNAHTPSDCPLPHQDSKNADDRTVLYYANTLWDPAFAGETVFFDKNEEIIRSVIPRPGRIVIFNSAITHCARVPTGILNGLRLTLAFKFSSF